MMSSALCTSSLSEVSEPTGPGTALCCHKGQVEFLPADELGLQPGALENQTLAGATGHHSPAAAPCPRETPTPLHPKPTLYL